MRWMVVAALCAIFTSACGSGRAQVTGPSAVASGTATQAITVDIGAGSVSLRVGEELVVRQPDPERRWEVTTPGGLELLASPDATGDTWRFRARRAGSTQLMFTGHSRQSCPTPADCPPQPAPPRITLLVDVQN